MLVKVYTENNFYQDFKNIILPYNVQYTRDTFLIKDTNEFLKLWYDFSNACKKYSKNIYDCDDFIKGYVAMKIIYPPELRDFSSYIKLYNIAKTNKYNIVSIPEHEKYKNIGLSKPSDIMSITSKSKNKDLAWNIISFANGKEYCKHYITNSKHSFTGGLPSFFDKDIKNIILKNTNFDFTPFYLNKGTLPDNPKINNDINTYMDSICLELMYKNIRSNISTKDIFTELQVKFDDISIKYTKGK
ncbi:hypothetical protein G8V03_14365 [Clostridium botulinum D/C]|uniref:hypothetical protein n=1 Tax=Clostridium botulinum TaxID=1491 RepID=UPI001E36BFD9|nr:hypothetical protein [Clostridium botulinum]MCD3352143.1 hypothetical protein [Clostridium botulinum D/C]MCD3361090.1 hypothetical protein [Clostridium botulinum D/C]MCD3363677.1 hypothetical protein [Clostridium botulinum D/C]MCD3366848.1 hypothetical protein [Clostridium botulinum D/C]